MREKGILEGALKRRIPIARISLSPSLYEAWHAE
jgi:hypothetical protein